MAKVFFSSGFGFQTIELVSFSRSFQFSFLPLVKVLVNCGFRLFGESFGQATLAQVLFFSDIHFWRRRLSKLASFLRSVVLVNRGFHLVSMSLNQFRFGWSKFYFWLFGILANCGFHSVSEYLNQFRFGWSRLLIIWRFGKLCFLVIAKD